jgi:hypothetical protein
MAQLGASLAGNDSTDVSSTSSSSDGGGADFDSGMGQFLWQFLWNEARWNARRSEHSDGPGDRQWALDPFSG